MTETYWYDTVGLPLLALLQVLPLIGAALVWRLDDRPWAGALGRGLVLLELLLAVVLLRVLDSASPVLQLAEFVDLPGPLDYHAAADGVTVLFVLLTALITLLVSLYSLVRGFTDTTRLLAVVLAVEGVMMSLLVTVNLLWFALVSALEVALIGYLLWRWATTDEKELALARFYQFQGTGLLLFLLGALIIGWAHADATGGQWSFDLLDLSRGHVAGPLATVVFFLLFYGLAVRTPLFPMHGWLPIVAHHGNVAIAPAFLLGIKLGVYGLVRFVFPIVPEAVQEWHQFAAAFAAVGVFYAAFLAFVQTNLRRMLAFAVVSHTSLVVLGLFSLHPLGFQGGLLLAVNFGLATTAMLFMVGFVHRRTRTTRLARLGGLFDRLPFIGITFLVGGFAIVGMPGTPGFDAAHLLLEASIEKFGALPTVAAALGNVLAAGFLLYAFQRAFLAPATEGGVTAVARGLNMEHLVAGCVLAVLLVTGFHLEPWLRLVEVPLAELAARFGHVAGH
jgi:NADH-quinone oxidoreductase subunit M